MDPECGNEPVPEFHINELDDGRWFIGDQTAFTKLLIPVLWLWIRIQEGENFKRKTGKMKGNWKLLLFIKHFKANLDQLHAFLLLSKLIFMVF